MSMPVNRDGLPSYPAYYPLISPSQTSLAHRTAEIALAEGYDPEDRNARISQRAGALAVDAAIYAGIVAVISLVVGMAIVPEAGFLALSTLILVGPAGFFAYRAAGDAIFEGSPGKHVMGLDVKGRNGLPVSAGDGITRNLWILPSMIPVAGWFVSAGMLAWMTYTAEKDALGRGGHERSAETRVVQKRRLGR